MADWPCLMQDDLNGVSANVSIFATITVVIVSALNPALWALIAPEGAESRPGTKQERRALVLYPVLSSPPGDCRPRLSTLAGLFSALLRPCLSLGDALGQLLAAAAHIGAAAPDRDWPRAPGSAGPRQTGAVPSGGTLLNANRK
jgi:hypothetical protein